MKQIWMVLFGMVLVLGFVSAGTCTLGETECSDGVDNDNDDLYDYFGDCDDPLSSVDCSSLKTAAECQSACEAVTGGVYTGADADDCMSPLDIYEGTGDGTSAYGAPAFAPEEEGIFSRFIDWLIFWN